MNTYVMLFRGINVGGRNILPMKRLVSLLEAQGFADIKTYIQSGNVLVDSAVTPNDNIRMVIESEFGFTPNIMIFEISEFETMVTNSPFTSVEGKTIHFFFCSQTPSPNTEKMQRYASPTEQYELKGNVFYLYAPDGIGRSKLAANTEACLGVPATARNLNTVSKILSLATPKQAQ